MVWLLFGFLACFVDDPVGGQEGDELQDTAHPDDESPPVEGGESEGTSDSSADTMTQDSSSEGVDVPCEDSDSATEDTDCTGDTDISSGESPGQDDDEI